jgi:hypothetical protein
MSDLITRSLPSVQSRESYMLQCLKGRDPAVEHHCVDDSGAGRAIMDFQQHRLAGGRIAD